MALGAPPRASGVSLNDLLSSVEANARFDAAARADVLVECTPGCPTPSARAALFGRGDALYVEVKGGTRALITADEIRTRDEGAPRPASAGAVFVDDVLLEDLRPLTRGTLRFPQVSDSGPAGTVVTGAPARPSTYALLVYTIDPERPVVIRTQYYEGDIGNLTKIRRDAAFTAVGGHLRPGEVTIERFKEGRTTHLRLTWREARDVPPGLFDPAALVRPSPLTWD